jgi:hypothetical protein
VKSIDQAREELRLVAAELRVTRVKALQSQAEADVDTSYDVLDFKVHEFSLEFEFVWKYFNSKLKNNSQNFTGKFSFCMIRAYLRAARRESASLLAPVHTILPELNMSAVVLGERMRMMTAAKRFGLYSALRA